MRSKEENMDEKNFNTENENRELDAAEPEVTEEAIEEVAEEVTEEEVACEEAAEEAVSEEAHEQTTAQAPANNSTKGLIAAIIALSSVLVIFVVLAALYFGGVFDRKPSLFTPSDDGTILDYMALETVSGGEYIDENGMFNYTAADLSQYVSLCDYTKLTVKIEKFLEITDEDVDVTVESMLESAATLEVVDRAAENGDTLDISFVGYVDGEAFEGGTADNYSLVLGSNTFIDGFESGLVGAKAGDAVTLNLTFPEEYHEELAGKDVVFEVTVNSVSATVIPELTNEFIAANTDFATVEEFLAVVRVDLETANVEKYEQSRRAAAWSAFVNNCRFTAIPAEQVDYYFNYFSSYYANMANQYYTYYGIDIETFYAMMGINDDVLREMARLYVCEDLVYYSLASVVELTEEEYEKGLADYLEQYGVTEEEFFASYTTKEELEVGLKYNKVLDTILATAEIEYVEPEVQTEAN